MPLGAALSAAQAGLYYRFVVDPTADVRSLLADWIARLSRSGRLTAALNIYRANLGLLVPRAYPRPAMPILGMWSDGDIALCEEQMTDSGKHVAGPWRYERVAGANHWLQLTAPRRVNRLLLDFLR